jgi:hypothetical protein
MTNLFISLNEAFRYQNYLTRIRQELVDYLEDNSFVITRTEEHYKKKAVNGLQDETVMVETDARYIGITPNDVIRLLGDITKERERVSAAVFMAKSSVKISTGIGVDEAVMLNKERRAIADTFKKLAFLKPNPQEFRRRSGQTYYFTGSSQTTIYYDVLVKSAIDYDRNIVKSEYKRLLKEADAISAEIDEVFARRIVDFKAAYDIQSTIADILESAA